MEDIKKVEDLIQFILQADEIEWDVSIESDIIIPIHDISPEEFLNFAENAIVSESKEGMISAISNLKRALDCEMDMFFESINLNSIFKKKSLKFEKKTQFLADIGLFPIKTINKLNSIRNKMEHEYKAPEISDLHAYYELVWSVVRIVDLYLELLHVKGEIYLVLYSENNEYYFMLKHDVDKCVFKFDIVDWTKGNEREQKQLVVGLQNQDEAHDFIKAFSLYLASIQYFDYGNEKLYKEKIKKLKEKK